MDEIPYVLHSSIAFNGRSCSALLLKLSQSLEISEWKILLPASAVIEESERYESWAKNIAALQDADLPSSLEYRLRDDENARRIIKKALIYLEESLEMALSIVRGEKRNDTWDITSPVDQAVATYSQDGAQSLGQLVITNNSTSSELQELGLAIRDAITHLFELSMIIRKKSEKDEYTEASLKHYLDPTADIIHVGDKYPLVKATDPLLMSRLGTALSRRRQYLLFRREHQKRMEEIHQVKFDADGQTVWSGERATTYLPDEALGITAARQSNPEDFCSRESTQYATTEYADSSRGKDRGSDMLRTPLLPKDSKGVRVTYNEHFVCHYCRRPLKVENKTAWKRHVFSDLKPYVCTFEACGLNMFESQHQWFDHELRFHRAQWSCRYCKESHPVTRPDLEIHIKSAHTVELNTRGVDDLVNSCHISQINATSCPLCTEFGAKLQKANQSDKCAVTLKQFQQHLGRHMEQLALAALPPEDSDSDEDADDPVTARKNRAEDSDSTNSGQSVTKAEPNERSDRERGGGGGSMAAWWTCCGCTREVNPTHWGSSCPDCSHCRCSYCTGH